MNDGTTTTEEIVISLEHDTTSATTTVSGASFDLVAASGSANQAVTFDLVAGDDASLDSGSTFWQGQDLGVINSTDDVNDIAGGGDNLDIGQNAQLQVRSFDSADDEVGGLENEFSLDSNYSNINTDDLDGDYVLTLGSDSSKILRITNGEIDGYVNESSISSVSVDWEVTSQSLSTEFDDDSVNNGQTGSSNELDINTNRGTSDIEVSADGLDSEELLNIFSASAFNADQLPGYDDDSDDTVVLEGVGDIDPDAEFQGIDAGEYEFTFSVTDSTAEDTSSVEVTESDVNADFSEGVYTQTAGDVVEMTIELEDTDDAYVQIGGEDAGFVDILYVEDDDDDEVTFQFNTRTAGTGVAFDQVYNTEDDIVESTIHGGVSTPDNGIEIQDGDGNTLASDSGSFDDSSGSAFAQYLDNLGLIANSATDDGTDQLIRPLQPTSYDVAVNSNNIFVVNDDDESELDDELALATLELTQPSVDNVQTWTGESSAADDEDNLSDLTETLTQRTEIAADDQLVIQAEATGLYGHMVAIDEDRFDALDDGFSASTLDTLVNVRTGEGINLGVEASDASGNQQATALNLGGSNVDDGDIFVLADNESGELYIVVDTSSSDAFTRSLDTPEDFSAELEYEADEDNRFEFNGNGPAGDAAPSGGAAYPYFQSGEDNTQTVNADFSIADRSASFDNLNAGEDAEVAVSETATVSGETNVAPGSSASVRVRSDDGVSPSFVETTDVEIAEDGSFSAEFDLSSQAAGDTGTAAFRVGGSSVDSTSMVLVEDVDVGGAFTVSDLNPSEATVTAGDSVTVSATVENTGSSEATETVSLTLDGDELDSQDVTLEGGASTTVEFTADTSGLDAGDYEHGVSTESDSQTGTLTIEADDDGEDGTDGEDGEDGGDGMDGEDGEDGTDGEDGGDGGTDDSTPGFGALVALVALIAAALLATRRNE